MSDLLGTLSAGGLLTLLIAGGFGFAFALVADQGRRRAALIGGLCALAVGAILSASPVFRANIAGTLSALLLLCLFASPVLFYAYILRRIRKRNAPQDTRPAGLRLIERDDALFVETLTKLQAENAQQPSYSRDTFSIAWREQDGTVLASVRCEMLMGLAEIRALYVTPQARGRGLGRDVLNAALDEAKSRGATRATLHTFDWQVPEFYRHLGWHETGQTAYPAGPIRHHFERPL